MEYERSTLTEFHLDIFYVLKLLNQMAFDSFILADGFLYVSQITIASPHEIERHSEFFSQPTLPAIPLGSGARFVFVFPLGKRPLALHQATPSWQG
jgi:hypothetical protein